MGRKMDSLLVKLSVSDLFVVPVRLELAVDVRT